MLTAEGAESRKVEALGKGAADYITKPFSTPELLARVRVALRHRRPPSAAEVNANLTVGDMEVDLARHRVVVRGADVELTPKEFAFLAALARHPGRVLTHRMLLREVWGPEYATETQYLRVYASQLRKKIADDPARPYLVTEPGVGYRLVDPATNWTAGHSRSRIRPEGMASYPARGLAEVRTRARLGVPLREASARIWRPSNRRLRDPLASRRLRAAATCATVIRTGPIRRVADRHSGDAVGSDGSPAPGRADCPAGRQGLRR